jgi:hypothetical protein
MSEMRQPQWRPRISTDEMMGRLILAALVVGAFVFLGLWLRSGSLLDWFATVTALSCFTFFGGTLRGTPLEIKSGAAAQTSRFAPLLDALSEHPLLRALTSNIALRIGTAVTFGIVIASIEQLVGSILFGWTDLPHIITGLLSLALVLFPVHFGLALLRTRRRYRASDWIRTVKAGVEVALGMSFIELSPLRAALLGAALRTGATVLVRAIAVLVFPPLFDNWFAVGFIAVVAVTLIVGGDTLAYLIRSTTWVRNEALPTEHEALPTEHEEGD